MARSVVAASSLPEEPRQCLPQRRPDARPQGLCVRVRHVHSRQRVADAVGDAFEIVGERAVQVEEQRARRRSRSALATDQQYAVVEDRAFAACLPHQAIVVRNERPERAVVGGHFSRETGMITDFPS